MLPKLLLLIIYTVTAYIFLRYQSLYSHSLLKYNYPLQARAYSNIVFIAGVFLSKYHRAYSDNHEPSF